MPRLLRVGTTRGPEPERDSVSRSNVSSPEHSTIPNRPAMPAMLRVGPITDHSRLSLITPRFVFPAFFAIQFPFRAFRIFRGFHPLSPSGY